MQPRDPLRRILAPFNDSLSRLTRGIDISSLWRWAKLSVLIGLAVGLCASLVFFVLEWAESYAQSDRPWWLVVALPAAGGLVSGLLVHIFTRDRRRQGIEIMVECYHQHRAVARLRYALVRAIGSVFTLGTGGSAGREGPMAYLGAALGSSAARRLKLSARDRRLLLLAGAAGGISALFRTPLGAAIWALEILYNEDFESDGMFPCLVSSVTAYSVSTSIFDQNSLFVVPHGYEFHPLQLFFYVAMALVCGLAGLIWIKSIHGSARVFDAMSFPRWLKPAVGGLLLGALALGVPWVYGSGYGWMQEALRDIDDSARALPIGYHGFWLLFGLAFAKMLATMFTVGSGGSGGTFAPSLLIGGFIGGAFGLLFHELAPSVVTEPGAFVLVGAGAFYAGVAKTPISTIIMISELFGSYDLLVPSMLAVMTTAILLRRFSLHRSQVESQLESPAHMAKFTVDVLEDLKVEDHFFEGRGAEPLPASMPLSGFLDHVSATAESFFVVAKAGTQLCGVISLDHVRSIVGEDSEHLDIMLVSDAMSALHSVAPSANLRVALDGLVASGQEYLPVIDPTNPSVVVGMISQGQIAAEYNAEILRRRLGDRANTEVP